MRISDWSSDVCSSDLEAARLAGADVEQAADARMIEQPQHHVDAVADPDEVAKLPAVGVIRVVRLEQLRRLALAELAEQVPGDARLAALVVLVGAIDVEELEARPLRSEEHTSELQSLMRISYAVFCLK